MWVPFRSGAENLDLAQKTGPQASARSSRPPARGRRSWRAPSWPGWAPQHWYSFTPSRWRSSGASASATSLASQHVRSANAARGRARMSGVVDLVTLQTHAKAVGGTLEVNVVKGRKRVPLLTAAGGHPVLRGSRASATAGLAARPGRQGGVAKPDRGSSATAVVTKGQASGLPNEKRPVPSASPKRAGPSAKSKVPTVRGPSS